MGYIKRPLIIAIEDDPLDQEMIETALNHAYDVHSVPGLVSFVDVTKIHPPNLILLDISLRNESGFDLYKTIRSMRGMETIPIFFVTAHRKKEDKLLGLRLGADDYITKPFDLDELFLRVSNRLQREDPALKQPNLVAGKISVDPLAQKTILSLPEGPVRLDLTPLEFKLLLFFLRNRDCDLSREDIVAGVWGGIAHISLRTVDTHIKHLRRKLRDEGGRIRSVPSVGFRFSDH